MSKICVLCGGSYEGEGNNAEPLAEGKCCDKCNERVLSARVAGLRGKF